MNEVLASEIDPQLTLIS